jgi:hypothetical protein
MSFLEGLYVDVGYPRDKIQFPKIPEYFYVAWTQMLIPDRFREFVEMRYNNSARIPVAISWYKKCQKDEDWVNWFADQAGLARPLHFFHNDRSLNEVKDDKKKTNKKNQKAWNKGSTEQLFGA